MLRFCVYVRLLLVISLTNFLITAVNAQALANEKMVFLIKSGTDSSGNPMYRMATSQDQRAHQIYNRFWRDEGVQKVIESHQQVESNNNALNTPPGYHNIQKPSPVFVEIGNQTGTYNDWKGTFSVQDANGRLHTYDEPRVVLDLNDNMWNSRDQSLVEQTLVHEIGHGIMRKLYGKSDMPDTPWLGRPHYGDLVTDEQLALIEGWAEFVGAEFTGRHTIAEDPADSLTMNAYAYQDNGQAKTPEQLFKTEGWVATVMLHISKHPSINNGYQKLLESMRLSRAHDFNAVLRKYLSKYPEDGAAIEQILAKASINQFNKPMGGEIDVNAGDPSPPPVDIATTQNSSNDQNLLNLFNDYQSSLNTYAQLRLDRSNIDWYRGAWPQEIQRRMSFQLSLVKSLESRLISALRQTGEIHNQQLIAQTLLDNMEKIRFEHNRTIQSYQKTNWWNHSVRNKLKIELELYKELYSMNKTVTDNVHTDTLYEVWNQRNARMQYRIQQAEASSSVYGVPSKPNCNAAQDEDCRDAYNKLIGAIKANSSTDNARLALENYKRLGQ